MNEYEVIVHKKVYKFLEKLKERPRMRVLGVIRGLGNHPSALRRYDIRKFCQPIKALKWLNNFSI